jgi:hypothetical protein
MRIMRFIDCVKGEIVAFNYYCPPKCKTKGTRSTPYYSTKRNYLSLTDLTTTIQLVNEKSCKRGKEEGRGYYFIRDLLSCR